MHSLEVIRALNAQRRETAAEKAAWRRKLDARRRKIAKATAAQLADNAYSEQTEDIVYMMLVEFGVR